MARKSTHETLVLLDVHAILHRAYHALPPLTTKNGETVQAVWAQYDAELRKEKNVDFDDLLTLPVKIMKENPEIKEKLNKQ